MIMDTRVSVLFRGTGLELARVVALAQAGRIQAHAGRFSMIDLRQDHDGVCADRLNGRAVVIPGARAA
jgi:hypothetical protein